MKKTLILALPVAALVAACAAPAPSASTRNQVAAAGNAQYCKKDRLYNDGDKLTCTWSASISDACENNNLTSLSQASVAAPATSAGRCGNGQWLVMVTTK
jgi:hypothetical protein